MPKLLPLCSACGRKLQPIGNNKERMGEAFLRELLCPCGKSLLEVTYPPFFLDGRILKKTGFPKTV